MKYISFYNYFHFSFNRTIVELKWDNMEALLEFLEAFNRTIVELK